MMLLRRFPWLVPAAPGGPTNTPAFAAEGAGTDGTGTLSAAYPTGISGGTGALILQVTVRSSSGQAPDTPSGWTLLAGPHSSTTPTIRQWIFGKIPSGSESGSLSVTFAAGTSRKTARMYRFTNVASLAVEDVDTSAGDTATVNMTAVTAGGNCRLACAFLACDDDDTVGAPTGETGGNWVEPGTLGEYLGSGLNSMIQLFTADLVTGGTITGGTATLSNDDEWIISSFALVGT
jgi:hypothetical protein